LQEFSKDEYGLQLVMFVERPLQFPTTCAFRRLLPKKYFQTFWQCRTVDVYGGSFILRMAMTIFPDLAEKARPRYYVALRMVNSFPIRTAFR